MALVTSPLFSFDASGEVGKSIVYSKWKGRDYVRKYVVPKNPSVLAQQFQRQYFAALVDAWHALLLIDPGTYVNAWDSLGASESISGFNAFMKFNLNRLAEGLGFQQSPSGLFVDGDASTLTPTATSPGPNRLQITATPDDEVNAGEVGIITIGTASGANTTANTIKRVVQNYPNGNSAAQTSIIKNVPAGTYFVAGMIMRGDGSHTTYAPTGAGVVVADPS